MADQDIHEPLFIGCAGMDIDSKSGDLKILFLGQDENRYHVRLAHGIVPLVMASMLGLARESWEAGADPQSRQEAAQSLTVTAVNPWTSPEGEPGLRLTLEDHLVFPLLLPGNIVDDLNNALEIVSAGGKPTDTDSHH